MLGFITKLLGGNKSEKDIRGIQPIVEQILEIYPTLESLSNDELRSKSDVFRQRIKEHIADLDGEINTLKLEAESDELDFDQKEERYKQIDELEKERYEKIEEVLNEILPEAFGVMKETARRFSENETLEVTVNDLDRDLAATKDFVTIDGDKAFYKNTWMVRGIPIKWNMVHYDVQLIGGVVLHQGKIAEMATGEGKTLVSTLPAYLNALTGLGVHIVTVNDYLASRDSEWMGRIYKFLGLTVGCIQNEMDDFERQEAYKADITYGTNNEFGFDYLRDNMKFELSTCVQRGHYYAIVDEVDSILIDEARTPLIISGASDDSTSKYYEAN